VVLERLTAEGLIEADREEAHDGRLRRYYRLTNDGRGARRGRASRRHRPGGAGEAAPGGPGDSRSSRMSSDLEWLPALTALMRQAYESGDALGTNVAGKLWQAPQPRSKFNALQAEQISLLSGTQAVRLHRILVLSD
jgi:Transcriptional regulator PadR-like family